MLLRPENGLEVNLDIFADENLISFRSIVGGRSNAARLIEWKHAIEIVKVLRGYAAFTIVTCQSAYHHDLIIQSNGTFVFQSTFTGIKIMSGLTAEEMILVADAIERRLPEPVLGTRLSDAEIQATMDDFYPVEAARRIRREAKFTISMNKTIKHDARKPTVWQKFRELVLADIKSGRTSNWNSEYYRLHAGAPEYTRDVYVSRFIDQFPQHRARLGWYHAVPSIKVPPAS